jgi:ribosomal protein S18 acetylase RimI-like enzyme
MPLTNSAILEQLEWWEGEVCLTEKTWARKERAMEPERLQPRPFAGQDDQRAVVELLLSAQAAEPGFDWPGAGQLRALLADPELDHMRDTCLWEDKRGRLVAFAVLRAGRSLLWFTRPAARSDGLDALIVAWATLRAREQAAPGAAISLRTEARESEMLRLASLARLGFVALPDASLRLTRSLATSSGASEAPAGYRIRPLAPDELGAYLALARELYPHASRLPLTEGRRRALMADPAYTSELDLIVEAADGALVGFCHASLRPDERERLGRRAGWIELLGVAPAHRRVGLARALLHAGLLALADYGADRALLTVRADNAYARALYDAEGFTSLFEERAYTLTLE